MPGAVVPAEEMTGMSVQPPGGENPWSAWQTEIERTIRHVRNIGELVAESDEPAPVPSFPRRR